MVSLRRRLRSLGASANTLELVQLSHRPSTQTVYACHWARWFAWCSKNGVSPQAPSEVDLANHLAHLASAEHLSPSCLRVRRAAILTTLRQLGLPVPSSLTLVNDVVRGAASRRVVNTPHTPKWDVFLVLAFLRSQRFEPLISASLPYLTYKTLFLITLATARRVSEVHSLSGLAADVSFLPDGSMQLGFLPEFLAKNQVPGDPSPVLTIPSLEAVLCNDDPDRVNCPVRALKYYRNRTEASRSSGQRRLFLSLNQQYTKDIQKPALARWAVKLITEAYSWASSNASEGSVPLISAKPHEIRAWSASLGHANGTPIRQLLQAAYWRREDIFINHYLRDNARLLGDGSHGIHSLIAAQTILSSRSRT